MDRPKDVSRRTPTLALWSTRAAADRTRAVLPFWVAPEAPLAAISSSLSTPSNPSCPSLPAHVSSVRNDIAASVSWGMACNCRSFGTCTFTN